jgi:hypothetical protein
MGILPIIGSNKYFLVGTSLLAGKENYTLW